VSRVAESRSIAYSADTAGRAGRIACQVIRSDSLDDGRVSYAIAIRNDTDCDAQASASVPDAEHLRHRTIVQSVIAAHSQFSTAVELEVGRVGEVPELHVQLSGEDIDFALIVPNANTASGPGIATPRLAIAAEPRANASHPPPPAGEPSRTVLLRAVPRTTSRRDYPSTPRSPDFGRRGSEPIAILDTRNSPAFLPIFAIFLGIMLAVTIAVFRPQIRELTVPAQAPAQTSIPVTYRATGFGSVAFRVVGPDGSPRATGSLATGAGSFAITFPKDRADRTYLVRVGINGIFGSAAAENYVNVPGSPIPIVAAPPQPPAAPPQIRSLALDRATLTGGDTLNVYYDVAAAGGSVALLDAASRIAYGKSELSPSGHTAFVIPSSMQSERFLTVVVTAQRGRATTQSRVAVTVEPQTSPTPQADASGFGAQSSASATAVPVIDSPKSVGSAQAFRIDIHDAVAGLVLVLSDDVGTELARREITSGSAKVSATFTAPAVRAPTPLRLVATYPEGAGSETIVKAIEVTPR
jgi:hypothetical protein